METSRGIHKLKPQAKSKMPTSNLVSTSEQVMACTGVSIEERHAQLKLVRFEQAYHKTDDLF